MGIVDRLVSVVPSLDFSALVRICLHIPRMLTLVNPIEPETSCTNPHRVNFTLLKVSDIIRVDENGNRVDGADKPVHAAGIMTYSTLHQSRPDIHAACYMHGL